MPRSACSPASTFTADHIGIWTSWLCVAHCLLTPVLLSMSAVLAHFLPSEEHVHRTLAVFIAFIGAVAIVRGFRRHRRRRVIALMAAGLAILFFTAFYGDLLPNHIVEVGVTFCGSLLMISAHRINHTFCKRCDCVPSA
ncbi:MerC domain-containing protein [Silvibacterium sp.]|uniref:MerC domain-containing protein n=1 Tax=Silvibacterium sp. TaxID=1964179 RepID=UPI0039E4F0E2